MNRTGIIVSTLTAVLAVSAPALANEPVKVSSSKVFAGVRDIVIASFDVAFVTERSDSASSGRMLGGRGSSSNIKAELAGVSTDELQAATDAAYSDFVAKLTAAGYHIVDRSAYAAYPAIAKMGTVASGAVGSIQYENHSKAKAQYFAPTSFGPTPIVSSAITGGMFGALSNAGPSMARVNYTQHTHQPVMDVRYVVDFASAKRKGGAFNMSSSVKITAQLAVMDGQSTVTLTNGQGSSGVLTLNEPVVVEGDFGELADTTTGGHKRAEVIGNVIGGLFGGGMSKSKSMTFTAKSAQYQAGAVDASKKTNTLMVGQMAAIK